MAIKTEFVFYVIGILFAIAAVIYFSYAYLFDLARSMKLLSLGLLTVSTFLTATYLREVKV